jgi:hypothetical protein
MLLAAISGTIAWGLIDGASNASAQGWFMVYHDHQARVPMLTHP